MMIRSRENSFLNSSFKKSVEFKTPLQKWSGAKLVTPGKPDSTHAHNFAMEKGEEERKGGKRGNQLEGERDSTSKELGHYH